MGMKGSQIFLNFEKSKLTAQVESKKPERTEAPDLRALPHFRSMVDVIHFLKKRGYLKTAAEMHPDTKLEALRWEQILLRDLEEAKRQNASEDALNELRKLIFAVSWDTHARPDVAALLRDADRLADEVKKQAQALGGRGSSPDDAREFLEEYLPQVQKIRQAIQSNACGSDAAQALTAMENFMEWNEKIKRLPPVRRLRDQIYFQSVYAPWCETAPREDLH